jgi:hypothetical protein
MKYSEYFGESPQLLAFDVPPEIERTAPLLPPFLVAPSRVRQGAPHAVTGGVIGVPPGFGHDVYDLLLHDAASMTSW